MANLQVKNVPEPLHAELRRRAALRHVTVRDYVLALIREDQRRPTLEEWLASVATAPALGIDGLDDDFAARLVREGRDGRDQELTERVTTTASPRRNPGA